MATALVYGWYGRGNVGDELMAEALRRMFEPRGVQLKFTDVMNDELVEECDGVIFGGGCILQDSPVFDKRAWELLKYNKRPVFYLGIGLETRIHDVHRQLMEVSRVVVTRSPESMQLPSRVVGIPDLAYSLPQVDSTSKGSGLLVIPNVEALPTHEGAHWSHVGWESFKNEFAQFLDVMVERNVPPTFLLMCKNDRQDDRWAAHEIIARMKHRSAHFDVVQAHADALGMTSFISSFRVVLTQRYHGIVLAQMAGTPHVSVDHHDKLKTAWPRKGVSVPFYGASKAALLEAYSAAEKMPREQTRIPASLYDDLAKAIVSIIEHERNARVEQVRGNTQR